MSIEIGSELTHDWTGQELAVAAKVMPPLTACGTCYWCTHHPELRASAALPLDRHLGAEPGPSEGRRKP